MKLALAVLVSMSMLAIADTRKPRISSTTTGLYPSKSCKTKIAGGEGQDPVLRCPAPKTFDVEVFFSAQDTHVTVTGKGKSVSFSGLVGNKLEWRLANGVPFALLVEISDADPENVGASINARVEVIPFPDSTHQTAPLKSKKASDVKNAWAKARELADALAPGV